MATEGPSRTSGQAKIGDTIWLDVDGDGLQDDVPVMGIEGAGVGLAGVSVRLYQDDGDGVFEPQGDDTLSLSTVTDSAGTYVFYATVTGSLWVEVDEDTLAGGLVGVSGLESVVSPHLLTVQPGETYSDIDFGYTAMGSVTGIVFYDRNSDGAQGLGEEGAPGVELCLYRDVSNDDVLGADDELLVCKPTDAQGAYVFRDVTYGNYLTVETPRPDVGHVTLSVLALDVNPWAVSGTMADPIGDVLLAALTGMTYLDSNGNGLQDLGETYGARGIVITATNLQTGASFSTVSTGTGQYELRGLMPAMYTVTAMKQAPNLVATTVTSANLVLGFGEVRGNVNFGYLSPTQVNLVDFTATAWGGSAVLRWMTDYEYAEEGFYIWRAFDEEGPYEIVSTLIPAANNPGGAEYQWMDLGVGRGQKYWYKLQEMPGEFFAGPIVVSIDPGPGGVASWVYTPFVLR